MKTHPKGQRARVLLSSVFGPYAQDDEFGSRAINPMELHHNQVTRAQGALSLRMFHRSWGIKMIQENISAPCTVLDFPQRQDFAEELRRYDYDVVGISSIIVNIGKTGPTIQGSGQDRCLNCCPVVLNERCLVRMLRQLIASK